MKYDGPLKKVSSSYEVKLHMKNRTVRDGLVLTVYVCQVKSIASLIYCNFQRGDCLVLSFIFVNSASKLSQDILNNVEVCGLRW